MDRITSPPAFEALGAESERLVRQGSELRAIQTRTCAHCGELTTFVLQDPAGWYACLSCGRYA